VARIALANPTRFMRINRDRLESAGVELLGGLALGAGPARAVTLNGEASFQRIRLIDETAAGRPRHAENNPEVLGRLELGVPLRAEWRLVASARYSGRQFCLNADTQREDELRGRSRSDLAVEREFALSGWGPLKRLRALFSLDNVGDVTAYDQCGLPQPGRTLRLTMTTR
jgi:iron complex outermembrane receptor protein